MTSEVFSQIAEQREALINAAYLVAAVLFILGLKGFPIFPVRPSTEENAPARRSAPG